MRRFCIRTLTLEQIRVLYAERLAVDFPPDELKPLTAIERALARGEYACYGAMAGEETLAYAFFVRLDGEGGGIALFDYCAVRGDLRGTGVGGGFIRALIAGPLRDTACVLLEVSEPACADDPRERALRERRLRFYLRNGLAETGVSAVVYGVTYRILALPVGPVPSPEETRRVYAAVYRAMLPAEDFDRRVEIR